MQNEPMGINEDFEPTRIQAAVLEALREENRATPKLIREHTNLNRQQVNDALNALVAAGWVTRVSRGLYEFVTDPRDNDATENQPGTQTD